MNGGIERNVMSRSFRCRPLALLLTALAICLLAVGVSADADAEPETYTVDNLTYVFNENGKLMLWDVVDVTVTEIVVPAQVVIESDTVDVKFIYTAFDGCVNLERITIPCSVELVYPTAFMPCSDLKEILVSTSLPGEYSSKDGVLFIDGVHGSTLHSYPVNRVGATYTVPDNTISIGPNSFSSAKNLTSVIVSSDVTRISTSAFSDCTGLQSVSLPSGLSTIAPYAFRGCASLVHMTIPDSVNSCGASTFLNCTLLGTVVLGSNIPTVSEAMFKNCNSLESVLFRGDVSTIEANAFENCEGLITISLPNSLLDIEDGAFKNCSGLTAITMSLTLEGLGKNVFHGCSSLKDIVLPVTLQDMGEETFAQCSGLESITFPAIGLGTDLFRDCVNLVTLKINTDDDQIFIDKNAFRGCPDTIGFVSGRAGYDLKVYNYDMTQELKGESLKGYDTWAKLVWTPNQDPGGSDDDDDGSNIGMIVGIAAVAVVIIGIGAFILIRRKG